MILKEHRKHSKLARPELGHYGRNEWAILGATCGNIQHLVSQIIAAMSLTYQCAYLDADHARAEAAPGLPGMLGAGAVMEYTDAIHSHRLQANEKWGSYQLHQIFNAADLILVNGNHHQAAAQIVVIDPVKKESLRKRLEQLTNVRLILLAEGNTQVYDFVEDVLPEQQDIPRLSLNDIKGITRFFQQEMARRLPPLNGLVLAGGRSVRMGQDKGNMAWHGKPQREYLADMLQPLCEEVFISCRTEQQQEFGSGHKTLPDSFLELGPFGAILSAFRQNPNSAWLVLACDLPLLDHSTLEFLIQNRSPKHIATTFESPHDQLPEPLITIWEPKSYAVLLSFLAQGNSCPRKVLLHSDAHILSATNPAALTNVNTPEDLLNIEPI